MKKIALTLMGALLVAGLGFAQSASPGAAQLQAQAQAQLTKISGKLELVQGVIALKTGGKTYLVPRLQRVAGFIKGVEEGATVALDGYENPLPYTSDVILFQATKLTVGGKDYDLGQIGAKGWAGRGDCALGSGMMQGKRSGGMRGGRW